MKSLIIIVTSRVYISLIAVFSLHMLTKIFSTEDLGIYYYVSALVSMINLVVYNPYSSYIYRNIKRWGETRPPKSFIKVILPLSIFLSFSSIIIVPIMLYQGHSLEYAENAIIYVVISVLFGFCYRLMLEMLNLYYFRFKFAAISSIAVSLGLLLSYCLATKYNNIYMWLYSICLIESVFSIILLFYWNKNSHKSSTRYLSVLFSRDFFTFIIPMALSNALIWIMMYWYRFATIDAKSIVILSLCISIPMTLFSILETIISQVFYPKFLEKTKNKMTKQPWKEYKKLIFNIYLTCLVSYFIFSDLIIKLFISGEFDYLDEIIYLSNFGIVVAFIRANANIVHWYYQMINKTIFVVLSYFLSISFLAFVLFVFKIEDILIILYLSIFLYLIAYFALTFKLRIYKELFKNIAHSYEYIIPMLLIAITKHVFLVDVFVIVLCSIPFLLIFIRKISENSLELI